MATLQHDLEASDCEGAAANTSDNRDIFRLALEFYKAAIDPARNEGDRWSKILALLSHILGDEHQREVPLDDRSTTPGVVWGKPPYTILELKSNIGVSGDASLQAVRAYIHECSLLTVCGLVLPSIQRTN